MRDAALLKTVYAFGLRRNEARMLDLPDLRRTPKAPQYRQYGGVFVRFGKASTGSPPKRRTVLTVPEMDWIVDVLDHWVTEVRPLLSPGRLPALFVTERSGRMSLRGLNTAFGQARVDGGVAVGGGLACAASQLRDPPGGVRLPREIRVFAGRPRVRQPRPRSTPTLGNCIRRARLRWSPDERGSVIAACRWRPVPPDLAGCATIPCGA